MSDSFVRTQQILPPKFDSIAERLMDQVHTTQKQDLSDHQLLFLAHSRNSSTLQERKPSCNQEIFQQLKELSDLLKSILSEYTLTGNYSSSFLREIIHNICLDLNVLLQNLDNQVSTESGYEVAANLDEKKLISERNRS